MRTGIAITAFTGRGRTLAARLAEQTGGILRPAEESLSSWTEREFTAREGLVFIGAAGIAVRAVAPHLRGKAEDPAVLVIDEEGRFVIPILSGHLGGANALARELAALLGATAVITTATDLNGVFAVDLWAKRQNMAVLQPERIRFVSGKLLSGQSIRIFSPWEVSGSPPQGVSLSVGETDRGAPPDVTISIRTPSAPDSASVSESRVLRLCPRCLTVGIGCRRGVTAEQIEHAFLRFCRERNVLPEAVSAAATIDRKQDEDGLLRFCEVRGLPLRFCSCEELQSLQGDFTPSDFVRETVGVDNVCERSAVFASGGSLFEPKYARDGVTLALAIRPPLLDWST